MSNDSFSEVENISYFSRIKNAFVGVGFGIIMFFGAIGLLFWNEGRAVKTYLSLKEGASAVIEVSPDQVASQNMNKLVHISGTAESKVELNDSFLNFSVNAIALRRVVEMYQWKETKSTKTKKKLGGGKERITTYNYNRVWSERHISSRRFRRRNGHENPANMPLKSQTKNSNNVKVGEFQLSPGLIKQIDNYSPFNIPDGAGVPELNGVAPTATPGLLYYGSNSSSPSIGDVRVSYEVVESQMVSAVGKQNRTGLSSYMTTVGRPIEILELGQQGAQQMFQTAQDNNTMLTWGLRALGFFLMFFGINMVLKPLSVLADVVPLIGNIVEFGAGIVAFIIAAPITLLTIAVAWITYRPLVAGGLIAAGIGVAVVVYMKKKPDYSNRAEEDDEEEDRSRRKPKKKSISSRKYEKTSTKTNITQEEDLEEYEEELDLPSEYYIYGKGKKFGPFSVDKLKGFLQKGKVKMTTPVRDVNSKEKIKLGDIPEFKKSA
jgi:hypothetical protein